MKVFSKLLWDYSMEKAKEMGAGALDFKGNNHGLSEGEEALFFLCKELIPGYLDGVIGEYAASKGCFVSVSFAE